MSSSYKIVSFEKNQFSVLSIIVEHLSVGAYFNEKHAVELGGWRISGAGLQ
jgi:hypothetical protein